MAVCLGLPKPSDWHEIALLVVKPKSKIISTVVPLIDNDFPAADENRSKKSPEIVKKFEKTVDDHLGGTPTGKRKFVRLSLRRIARRTGNVSTSAPINGNVVGIYSWDDNTNRIEGVCEVE